MAKLSTESDFTTSTMSTSSGRPKQLTELTGLTGLTGTREMETEMETEMGTEMGTEMELDRERINVDRAQEHQEDMDADEVEDDDDDDEEDDNQDANDAAKDGDRINHRVSLTYQNKLQLLRIFVQLRPLYLDPTVSKTYFWKRVNSEISQVLQLPFKSSVYTVKRLVKRRRSQLEHHKQHPSIWFRKVALDDLVDEVIDVFDEEKSKKRKRMDNKKTIHNEKENMRKSLLATKLVEETTAGSPTPRLPSPASAVMPMDSFAFLNNNAGKISDSSVMGNSHLLQHNTLGSSSTSLLAEIADSVNHLHNTIGSMHTDGRYESLAREIKSLREFTYTEFRSVNAKLDRILNVLTNE